MGKMMSGVMSLLVAFILLNVFNQQEPTVTDGTSPLFVLGTFLMLLAGTRKNA